VKRLALIFTLAILASIIAIPSAFAQDKINPNPGFQHGNLTDLNNIPITDTLKAGTMEWDLLGRYNEDYPRGRRVHSRLFVALFDNFELGLRWRVSRPSGPVQLAAKYKVLDEYNGFPISLAIGAEGITGNYQRTGIDPTYYAVAGLHDVHLIGWWDWYLGVSSNPTGLNDEDLSLFGGFKYWINDDFQILADYAGRNDNEDNTITAGLNYEWAKHLGFQGWVERDSVTEDNIFVLQLAVRGDLTDLTAEISDPE